MIKVIFADSSAVIRSIEKQIILSDADFEFLTSVGDGFSLLEKCNSLHPDLVVCSSDIPELKKTIRKIKLNAKQIVILKEHTREENLFLGIPEMEKPNFISMSPQKNGDFIDALKKIYHEYGKHKQGNITRVSRLSSCTSVKLRPFKVLLIGVSTGGPKSVQLLLESLGKDFPLPILITQHIDTTFDRNMVSWLNKTINLPVCLAENNTALEKGHVYFAPADCHLTLKASDNNIFINLDKSAPVNFLRPAVDKMFTSASEIFQDSCLAVLLTGMGTDGTIGCSRIKKVGGYTIGESEETCVVFGMPKAAFDAGVIDEMLPLYEIGKRVKSLVQRRCK